MNSHCIDCSTPFTITDTEIQFLQKIAPEFDGKKFPIPLPTSCPDCRLKRRNVQRNEQCFYHNVSAVTGKPLLSLYSPDTDWGKKYKIYTHEEWWSESRDDLEFGREFDFSRPFFEQYQELLHDIPYVNLIQVGNENCPFTTGTGYCKNCYLINCSENCENCYYGKLLQTSRDILDSSYVYDSELCYECFNVRNCYNCQYLSYSQNCTDCAFSENLRGCRSCFLCTNLNNKEFYFLNEPLTKEEYQKKVAEFLGSREGLSKAAELLKGLREKRIYKYANVINCEASTGDFLSNCKNCTDCYDVNDSEDSKYVTVGVNVKDILDCSNMYLKPELSYQVLGTIGTYNVHFSLYIFSSQNVLYSQFCHTSANLFGCAGLRKKEYCILNKQYTKEEYEQLMPRILEHMQKTGEWGQFFPMSMSPFGYNETVAQDYLPMTREEALAKNYQWKDPDTKEYKPQTYRAPTHIRDVKDDILKETLACEKCGKNYKIILQELRRLRDISFPVPALCPDCRHVRRMSMRQPRHLYDRACMKCGVALSTPFSPERPETVYCEKCYLEVAD
ncbi:MAG: hypothetical protein AAB551_04380 [Patescibacteria group bacterium]